MQGAASRRFTPPPRLLLVLALWAVLICGVQLFARHEMLTLHDMLERLVAACGSSGLGALVFVAAATFSPVLLVPAALLGGVAGACFGPALGVVYTLVGCNLSALLTYGLGRASRQRDGRIARLCAKYGPRLRDRPFVGVLLLRLSFLPYDPVNYTIGLLRVRLWPFLLANTLGCLPGVAVMVLAGNAINELRLTTPALNPTFLVGAGALLALSVFLAVVLRRRDA